MTALPSIDKDLCVRRLKVLADQTRLEILRLLMESPKHVGELNTHLHLEQSLLSHHLKVLRQEGFVESTRDGKAVLYQLAPPCTTADMKALDLGCCILSFD
ncbi:MAG: winged helix-turn-helix transcriptional regulator [Synechococcales cyanobacterium RU_4_20]|nr:winged helix-turn-helix transcriptional regulator [Synechococcales cyanobacterium RU_4_20]NJR70866.1 winged helix-turn-helix transcriptional regulator [Synechococcales cyanobacterium CRU_2_2]